MKTKKLILPMLPLLALALLAGFVLMTPRSRAANPPVLAITDVTQGARLPDNILGISPILVTTNGQTLLPSQSGSTVVNSTGATTNSLPSSSTNQIGLTYHIIMLHNNPFVFKCTGVGDNIGSDGALNPAAGNTNAATWGIGQTARITLVASNQWMLEPIHGTNWINNL